MAQWFQLCQIWVPSPRAQGSSRFLRSNWQVKHCQTCGWCMEATWDDLGLLIFSEIQQKSTIQIVFFAAKIADSRTNSLTCFIYFIGTPWTCWYNKELTYWMTIKIYLESAYLDSLEYRSRIEGHQMNSFFKPQKWSLVVWGHIKTWTFPTVLGCPEQ